MNKNKTMILIIIVLIILIITFSIFTKNNNKDKNVIINSYISKLKEEDIKTQIPNCDINKLLTYNSIPYFVANKPVYNDVNKEILTDFLLKTCYQNGEIQYSANINDNILSLILFINIDDSDKEYKTYNIDLKTNSLISNQELLNRYNISLTQIENILMDTFNNYYIYEKNNGSDTKLTLSSFLNQIGYEKVSNNNLNLYIENNNLYLYKTYSLTYMMASDDNYPDIITKFKLA